MTMKKLLSLTASALLTLSLAACGGAGSQPGPAAADNGFETITIRYGNLYNEETTQGQALNRARELIEAGSGGNVKVDIFHGGTLGSEKDHIQAQKEGSLELLFSGTAGIGLYVPATAVFEAWYAFESIDQMDEAVRSLRADLDAAFQEQGFKLLGTFYDGPRQILSNKRVTSLAELKGLKLRAPGSPIYVNSITALGAQAISMPLGDVYTSLQTGAVDAMEGTLDLITQQKFFEQGKYIIEDAHVFQPLFVTYNLEAWNKLSPQTQALVSDAVAQSCAYQMEVYAQAVALNAQTVADAGLEFVQVTDRDQWIAAVDRASAEYAAQYGELGQKIYDTVKSYQSK